MWFYAILFILILVIIIVVWNRSGATTHYTLDNNGIVVHQGSTQHRVPAHVREIVHTETVEDKTVLVCQGRDTDAVTVTLSNTHEKLDETTIKMDGELLTAGTKSDTFVLVSDAGEIVILSLASRELTRRQVDVPITSAAIRDGVIVGMHGTRVFKVFDDGSLDITFGEKGYVTTDEPGDVVLYDEKIVCVCDKVLVVIDRDGWYSDTTSISEFHSVTSVEIRGDKVLVVGEGDMGEISRLI